MNIKFFKIIKFFFGITLLFIYSCQNNNYNTIINLPDGFVSTVYVDSIAESVRHMAVKKMVIYMLSSEGKVMMVYWQL